MPEMYRILIDGKKYEAAHHCASNHGLNEDEVLKSQWLHSDYGKEAVQFFYYQIFMTEVGCFQSVWIK